jgi:flagellar biogenesis protein FliO
MPRTLFFYRTFRNLLLALGLLLETCFIQPCCISKVYALDSDSRIFDQNQNASSSQTKDTQSLALPVETPNPSPSLFATLLRLLVALIVIIGLIVLTVWGLKIVWEKRGWSQFSEEGKPLKILTSVHIAPRKAVYLIEVGNRILVVGVGNEEMNCLDVIQDTEEVNAIRHLTLQGFPEIFNRIAERQETADKKEETQKIIKESNQVVGDYVNKLKNMKKKMTASDSKDGES